MKNINRLIASVLLISMCISSCSRVGETVASSSDETTEVTTQTSARDNANEISSVYSVGDSYYYSNVDTSNMEFKDDLYVPTMAYGIVIDSIVEFIENGGIYASGNTYIGKQDNSGIGYICAYESPWDDIGIAYLDLNYDMVAELAILNLNDGMGYPILELYAYDSRYGVRSILHGTNDDRYYCLSYDSLYRVYVGNESSMFCNYYWDYPEAGIQFLDGYYTAEYQGQTHLFLAYEEEYLGTTDPNSAYVEDYGLAEDADNIDLINGDVWIAETNMYEYPSITPISEYRE